MTAEAACVGLDVQFDPEAPEFLETWDVDLRSANPIEFRDYEPPVAAEESVKTGVVAIGGTLVVCIHSAFEHSAGTMGVVAGERIVRAYRKATEMRLPVLQVVSSGGARLQEGMFALIQMTRVASAIADHQAAGLISAAILRSPTTGGVYASWVSLADLKIAEPEAVIGFGGPRVVEQVTGVLPGAESHSAEAALRHGLVDVILARDRQMDWLRTLFDPASPSPLRLLHTPRPIDSRPVPDDVWETVLRSRAENRPSGLDWAASLTDSWIELQGTDPAIRAGIATIVGRQVMVVAMDRHAGSTKTMLPGPAAFKLATRAVETADRMRIPVLTLVDTPGADPGPRSEVAGVAASIAQTLLAMSRLTTASVCLVVGEGGSGGAMALGHADAVLMLEGSVFSVISPESGAVVLFRNRDRYAEVARAFGMSAVTLVRAGVADVCVHEDVGEVREAVIKALDTAVPGQRRIRPDNLTAAGLMEYPEGTAGGASVESMGSSGN